jgi:hypothetical protein
MPTLVDGKTRPLTARVSVAATADATNVESGRASRLHGDAADAGGGPRRGQILSLVLVAAH